MDGSNFPEADEAHRVTGAELRQFVERIERLEAEKKEIADQIKEVLSEAKGRGYLIMAIRKIVKLRAQDPDKRAEEEAILSLYKSALGME